MFGDIDDAEKLILLSCIMSFDHGAANNSPVNAHIIAQHAIERMKQIFLEAVNARS